MSDNMKLKIINLKKYLGPVLLIGIVGWISNIYEFNYMNYDFFLNKYLFIISYYLNIMFITVIKNKITNIDLDKKYLFNLHILLNIMWMFLFFLYRNSIYSLVCICFDIIILILFYRKIFKDNLLLNTISFLWCIYLVLINFLIL